MCGRFSLHTPIEELIPFFGLSSGPSFERRYNIAPSQAIPIIRQVEGKRCLAMVRWGLIPFWAEDGNSGYRMINARAESVTSKPSFRAAFKSRRCIVPASGFYEWKKTERRKRPYYLYRQDGDPLALAGLWERWENPEDSDEVAESCAIITTESNSLVAELHHRMPAILEREDFGTWLDPHQSRENLLPLLRPAAQGVLESQPVSDYVNKPANEGVECIRPPENPGPSEVGSS